VGAPGGNVEKRFMQEIGPNQSAVKVDDKR
jgi:hypothetical protein